MTMPSVSVACAPRYATQRTPERHTIGHEIASIAERLGSPLMPWQELVAMVGGELLPDGRPAYRTVVIYVPRQSGKTLLLLCWELQRAIGWAGPQLVVYTAQTGQDARNKVLLDQVPLLTSHLDHFGVSLIRRANGNEAIEFANGSRIAVMASSADSGHGKTIHLAIRDELFADTDNRRDQALIPAMATIATAQSVTASTAGTSDSIPLNDLVERGRAAVLEDQREGIAFFEWSAEPTDDPDDEGVWWSCMPALGHTISPEVVRHARLTLPDGEFRRAFLNLPSHSETRLISHAAWQAVQDGQASPSDTLTMAVDVNAERSRASIVAADAARVVELVEHLELVQLVPRMLQLDAKHHPVWVADGHSSAPISSLLPEMQRQGLRVRTVPTTEYPAACGAFFDGVMHRTLKVRPHQQLTDAVAGAGRRSVGDGWTWTRKGSVDISPLVAATLALWVPPKRKQALFVY